MGTNFKDFKIQLEAMQDEIEDKLANTIKESIASGYENNLRTPGIGAPKRTGLLRSNIYVSLDNPITTVTGSKSNVDTSERDRTYSEFKNASTEKILRTKMMYITYTVDYASIVNDGSSKQRGQHFAERSIQDIESTLRSKKVIK